MDDEGNEEFPHFLWKVIMLSVRNKAGSKRRLKSIYSWVWCSLRINCFHFMKNTQRLEILLVYMKRRQNTKVNLKWFLAPPFKTHTYTTHNSNTNTYTHIQTQTHKLTLKHKYKHTQHKTSPKSQPTQNTYKERFNLF